MLQQINDRRSIRKYKDTPVPQAIIEEMICAAQLSPSAKNRQPWKYIVCQGKAKDELVEAMKAGIATEKLTHARMPQWANAMPDAENTTRIMEQAPCLIAVLNTNGHTPFSKIENEERIVEICDSLSIGAAIEHMILTAQEHGLGTLWIANTCFAYDELVSYLGTEDQLTGIVAVGYPNEFPAPRPRKAIETIVEYRN